MAYSANLDGIRVGDTLRCVDGEEVRITTLSYKDYASGYDRRAQYVLVKHSETNNNCFKKYIKIK